MGSNPILSANRSRADFAAIKNKPGHEAGLSPLARNKDGMALWREMMIAAMARNASSVTDYFDIPRIA